MVESGLDLQARDIGRGFPTDFPMVEWYADDDVARLRRGFPTDFPMVEFLGNKYLKLL